eukprot:scaffold54412_cov31-Tisochrysis_lutea.AAC.1
MAGTASTTVEDLIDYAGLRDIAEEVGIVHAHQSAPNEPGSSTPSRVPAEAATPSSYGDVSKANCAHANQTVSPVRLPSYGGCGPSVPESLTGASQDWSRPA